jgi:hypothetical protein
LQICKTFSMLVLRSAKSLILLARKRVQICTLYFAMDCGPILRQSEFGHSSGNGGRDVRRTEAEVGTMAARVEAAGGGADAAG